MWAVNKGGRGGGRRHQNIVVIYRSDNNKEIVPVGDCVDDCRARGMRTRRRMRSWHSHTGYVNGLDDGWLALHRNWYGGWADYTCRIQNEISNHLQNLYKNSRFMAFRHSPHIYLYTVAAARSFPRVVIEILPVAVAATSTSSKSSQ